MHCCHLHDKSTEPDYYQGYEVCPICHGEGVINESEPFPDDPDFCLALKCEDCNGSGVVMP
jgi:DnaJ-class molecular chaperone